MLGQPRTTQRRARKVASDEGALRGDIVRLASRFGRYGYRRVTEAEEDEHVDVHSREQQYVSTHDTADCTGRSHHRYGRRRVCGDPQACCRRSAQQVEYDEAPAPHHILHVVTEDP